MGYRTVGKGVGVGWVECSRTRRVRNTPEQRLMDPSQRTVLSESSSPSLG